MTGLLAENARRTGCIIYPESVNTVENMAVCAAKNQKGRALLLASPSNDGLFRLFEGETTGSGPYFKTAPFSAANAAALRKAFPWTAPVRVLREKCSFGCGDRLGEASAAHAKLFREYDAKPVLAQQSMRELTLTNRTFRSVMDDTAFQVYISGYKGGYGADGDHLKTLKDIAAAVEDGVTMITLDLSDRLHPAFADKEGAELEQAYAALPADFRARIEKTYLAALPIDSLHFTKTELMRCGTIYFDALEFAAEVSAYLTANGGKADLEISIDETTVPTLPEHHYFVAGELLYRKADFASLAPRFIGEFQKAIDYIGDLKEFKRQFAAHAKIAQFFGSYKISVHSGSDKFAVFPAIGELTGGRFHLKTAGTSWLEAVHAIALHDPVLFRKMYDVATKGLAEARKLYHVTADFDSLPAIADIPDNRLVEYLESVPGRQKLHITYGVILADPELHREIYAFLLRNEQGYAELLDKHFRRHLDTLGIGKIR